ncbi:SLATT domain-containing protein [Grimontia hollisae]|uniref:SLATT domain-containing protein n=1 Tax=Grimontia hollisae TaxID=673 RepID=UPI0023DADBF8|nr:SLATT domain-containing protein [Grimontia hollisae]MDF2183491.1 SLATT domain-containing protein [Grimontia hollisae]
MNINQLSEALSNQIWFTRKARIRAAERVNSNHFHSNLILIWYSFLSFCIAIILIKYPNFLGDNSDVIMTLATGAVFSLSLYVHQLDFKNRYNALKSNYISLQEIIFDLKVCNSLDRYKELYLDYIYYLGEVENHSDIDLLYFIWFESENCSRKLSFMEVIKLYAYVALRASILTLLYSLPVYLLVFYAL